MNPIRIVVALGVIGVVLLATDFVIHQVLLTRDYAATADLWRDPAEASRYMPWMIIGQLLGAVTFTILYALGFARDNSWKRGLAFGVLMALAWQSTNLIYYAVQPIPPTLVVKWLVTGLFQGALLGIVAWAILRPIRRRAT